MDGATFDRLTRHGIGRSRRDFVRVLICLVMGVTLAPLRKARAQSEGMVVLGGACTGTEDCQQVTMGWCPSEAICDDNGFSADGPLTCCTYGCCQSDADCCGDMRCAPAYEHGPRCMLPPFPTRSAGQICATNSDCFYWPGCEAACVNQQCRCQGQWARPLVEPPEISYIPDSDAVLAVAEAVAGLEVSGNLYDLYRSMHPDAQAIIPREAVIGWYENEFTHFGQLAPRAIKVRFISWTWEVTGKTYPDTAEVALRQQLPDGTIVRDEVRLVKDQDGNWCWFFGRTRAFVEEQIARFPEQAEGNVGPSSGKPCESSQDCDQIWGPSQCAEGLLDGRMQMVCLRDPGGACQSTDDCNQAGGPVQCVGGLRHGAKTQICLRGEGGLCESDNECMQTMTCNDGACGKVLHEE